MRTQTAPNELLRYFTVRTKTQTEINAITTQNYDWTENDSVPQYATTSGGAGGGGTIC